MLKMLRKIPGKWLSCLIESVADYKKKKKKKGKNIPFLRSENEGKGKRN